MLYRKLDELVAAREIHDIDAEDVPNEYPEFGKMNRTTF